MRIVSLNGTCALRYRELLDIPNLILVELPASFKYSVSSSISSKIINCPL